MLINRSHGGLRRSQGGLRRSREVSGGLGRSREVSGGLRRSQEVSGGLRRSQGGLERSREVSGGLESRSQDVSGRSQRGLRRSQELPRGIPFQRRKQLLTIRSPFVVLNVHVLNPFLLRLDENLLPFPPDEFLNFTTLSILTTNLVV